MSDVIQKLTKKKKTSKKEVAIEVKNISKTFKVPHEKHMTLKATALNVLRKKRYEEFQALKNINFEVKKGEFFGIIGRNGCGKSTLLKIIASIYIPTEGQIKIKGKISPFLELGVGFNPELTARENVFLGGSILGLSRKEIFKKFDEIIQFAELEEFVDMKFKNFSSGMQVRLAFSLSIYAHAEILLMDEVLAVGDANFQAKCLEEFKKYRQRGKTVVLVTHDIGTVRQHCDRAALLRNGKIVKIGKAEDVTTKYIAQNMSDQEAAEIKTDHASKLKQFGTKDIVITSTKVFDSNNKERQSFLAGDPMTVKIEYKAKKTVEGPHFGIAMIDTGGNLLCSSNHLRHMQIINKIEKGQVGYVECKIKSLPFLTGSYFITVSIYSDKFKSAPRAIHHIEKAKKINITNKNQISDEGMIFLNCDWKIS